MTHAPIDEDVLRRLAAPDDRPTTPARPLAEVRRRAGRLRLRRRGAAVSAVTAAAALTAGAVIGVPLPFAGQSSVVVGSERPLLPPGCVTGFADQISYPAAKDLLYLPAQDVAGPVTGKIFVRSERSDCPYARLAATAVRVTDGAVVASLSVQGPDAGPLGAATYGPDVVDRTLPAGARTVRLVVLTSTGPLRPVEASWTEPDGTTWKVETFGLDADRVLAAVAALQIDGGRLDLDSLPADLPDRRDFGDDEQRDRTTRSITVPFGSTDEGAPGAWALTVSDAGTAELALRHLQVGSREVTVPGVGTALWNDDPELGRLVWRLPDGPMFGLGGRTLTLKQARRLAVSLARTGPDDARLLAAKEGPTPTNT